MPDNQNPQETPKTNERINPRAPHAAYSSLSNQFYFEYKKAAKTLAPINEEEIKEGSGRFDSKLSDILDEDKRLAIDLERTLEYKKSLYPVIGANADQAKAADELDNNIYKVTTLFKKNWDKTLGDLVAHQAAEETFFNEQLAEFTRKAKLDNKILKTDDFEKKQRDAFKAYQEKQLAYLKQLYEQRERNFLERVQNTQADIQRLRGIGLTGQALVDTLTAPSRYGDCSNEKLDKIAERGNYEYFRTPVNNLFADSSSTPENERIRLTELKKLVDDPDIGVLKFASRSIALSRATKDFKKRFGTEPFPHGERAKHELCYSIELKNEGGATIAHVVFDTPGKQIAYQDRLAVWCGAADKLLAVDKDHHFDLTWAALSFPLTTAEDIKKGLKIKERNPHAEVPGLTLRKDMLGNPIKIDGKFTAGDQRYEAVLDMTRHILGQNPKADVYPGYLPPDYQKRFDIMMSSENREKIHEHARKNVGLTGAAPALNQQDFNIDHLKQSKTELSSAGNNKKDKNALKKEHDDRISFKKRTPPSSGFHSKSADTNDLTKDKVNPASSISFQRSIK